MKLAKMGHLGMGIMILIFMMGSAMAQDEQVLSADITLDGNGLYVWRGQLLTDDPVFQPGLSISAYGFTGSIWGNLEMTDVNGYAGDFTEIDYALDYSGTVPGAEKLGYSAGIIQYVFPPYTYGDLSTTEIYLGASLDVPLSPSFTWYRDINNINGSYIQLAIGHSMEKELSSDVTVGLDLSASFGYGGKGYNQGYFGSYISDIEAEWNDFTAGIGVPFSFKGGVSLTPSLNISTMMGGKINDYADQNDVDITQVWFGVSLSKSF